MLDNSRIKLNSTGAVTQSQESNAKGRENRCDYFFYLHYLFQILCRIDWELKNKQVGGKRSSIEVRVHTVSEESAKSINTWKKYKKKNKNKVNWKNFMNCFDLETRKRKKNATKQCDYENSKKWNFQKAK